MVKFAQQLQAELVPEWQEAYCSYGELKADLKRIQKHRAMGPTYTRTGSLGLLKSLASMKPSISGIGRTLSRRRVADHISFSPKGTTEDSIVINKRQTQDGDIYITELREPLSHSPQDVTFFTRLDDQLNKVNKFYKKKEAEYIDRAGALEKQMLALINVQELFARQGLSLPSYLPKKEDPVPVKKASDKEPLMSENSLKSNEYPLQTFPMKPSTFDEKGSSIPEEEAEGDNAIQDYIEQVATKNLKQRRAAFSDVNMELQKPVLHGQDTGFVVPGQLSPATVRHSPVTPMGSSLPPTPKSALKKVSQIPEQKEPETEPVILDNDLENQRVQSFKSQKELDQAKNTLRLAFVEFYRGLGLLSNYRSLNIKAFVKILKKYDKTTGLHFAPIYMKEVESSYLVISSKVQKLINKVEDIFTNHFSDGVRKKAMSQLRPMRKQGTHRTTFFIGLFTGCSIALCISFFFLVDNKRALNPGGSTTAKYLETVFPVFSTLMLITFHIYMYAIDVFAWAKTRVNYPFIFGFSPGTELRYREVLLLATGFTTFLLGGMNLHIAVTLLNSKATPANPGASVDKTESVADIIPLILVLSTLVTLFLPFNIMYRSARVFFLGCFRRLVSAPFVTVLLSDFFLGDQLTSQVLVFRNFQFISCYYPTGYFLTGSDNKCDLNPIYRGFGYIVASLPFWWRFLQCLKRWNVDRDSHQLQNAGKYMSAIVALLLRQAFGNHPQITALWVLSLIASVVATIYASYWDFYVDWGLLNKKSKNKWLRDKLILKNKSTYFVAIGANCFLRLSWMLSILQVDMKFGWNSNAFNVSTATLEILRRGIWNFFRIENEHLNNVGKYRAVKAVPLPFSDD
uniref:Uncharacterized protein n=1 Tax=Physcomitrium patens TaxID=3218 RepID=A0A7I4DLS2_PHYPA